jgi:hypothetical protein
MDNVFCANAQKLYDSISDLNSYIPSVKKPIVHNANSSDAHSKIIMEDADEKLEIPCNPLNSKLVSDGQNLVHKTNTGSTSQLKGRIEMEEYWHYVQIVTFWLHKLQAQGTIPQTNMDMWEMLKPRFKDLITEIHPSLFLDNPRITTKLNIIIKNVCEHDAIRRVFFNAESPYYKIPIKPLYALALSPFLSVSIDHITIAITTANDEILDNIRGKIVLAFLKASGYYNFATKFKDYLDIKNGKETSNKKMRKEDILMDESPDTNDMIKNLQTICEENPNGIKIDRKFCELTDFHKISWFITNKDENMMANTKGLAKIISENSNNSATNNPTKPTNPLSNSGSSSGNNSSTSSSTRPRFGLHPPVSDVNDLKKNDAVNSDIVNERSKKGVSIKDLTLKKDAGKIDDPENKPKKLKNAPTIDDSVKCVDINKLTMKMTGSVRIAPNNSVIPRAYVEQLQKQLITNGNLPDIPYKIFEGEILKMTTVRLRSMDKKIRPIPYDKYIRAINGEESMIVSIKPNDSLGYDESKINSMFSFETESNGGGKSTITAVLDIQTFKYLDGPNILGGILKELSDEFPLKKMHIPLMFHGPGAELSSITVGERFIDDDKKDTAKKSAFSKGIKRKFTNVVFESKPIDPYRAAFDYGLNNQSNTDQNNDLEGERTSLSSEIDLNDLYRIKHILYSHIMEFSMRNGKFMAHHVDYTKEEGDPKRILYKDLSYYFDSTRMEGLFKSHEPLRKSVRQLQANQSEVKNKLKRKVDDV